MRRSLLVLASSVLLLTGCVVTTNPDGQIEMAPLPAVVEIGPDGYYPYNGYHYFYDHDRWYYSNAREGRRRELPRSRWPREIRHHD